MTIKISPHLRQKAFFFFKIIETIRLLKRDNLYLPLFLQILCHSPSLICYENQQQIKDKKDLKKIIETIR
ncbi:hypothetical protein ACJMK2_037972, partial [Sinanodonta woodiana]